MGHRRWLFFALVTTISWGIWGALIVLPQRAGFPETLGYVVWALTMVPCSVLALVLGGGRLARGTRQWLLGLTVGLLGAGGQLLLFRALNHGPAYLVFPIISLSPVITVLLAYTLLKERARRRTWTGVFLAFPAIAMLSYQESSASGSVLHVWLPMALGVFLAWGIQAYVMKLSTGLMNEESVFFYMMAGAVAFIPVALLMTDFSPAINWGFKGPWLASMIQVLNSIGALTLVFALRHGKAIVVVPMTALAPVLTVILSLVLYREVPNRVVASGLVVATIAILLMAESDPPQEAAVPPEASAESRAVPFET